MMELCHPLIDQIQTFCFSKYLSACTCNLTRFYGTHGIYMYTRQLNLYEHMRSFVSYRIDVPKHLSLPLKPKPSLVV